MLLVGFGFICLFVCLFACLFVCLFVCFFLMHTQNLKSKNSECCLEFSSQATWIDQGQVVGFRERIAPTIDAQLHSCHRAQWQSLSLVAQRIYIYIHINFIDIYIFVWLFIFIWLIQDIQRPVIQALHLYLHPEWCKIWIPVEQMLVASLSEIWCRNDMGWLKTRDTSFQMSFEATMRLPNCETWPNETWIFKHSILLHPQFQAIFFGQIQ